MRNGSVLALGITIAGVGLLVSVIPFTSPLRRPPALHVVDEAGGELAVLTLSISNAQAFPNEPLFVRAAGLPLQARIAGRWTEVLWPQGEVKLASCALSPLKARNATLLVPAIAEACRVSFKYAGAVTRTKWRLARLADKLPTFVRYRIPRFWNWVGFEHYGPSSKWQDGSVDLLLPTGGPYPSRV